MELAQLERILPVKSIAVFRALARIELEREKEKFGQRQSTETVATGWLLWQWLLNSDEFHQTDDLMTDIELTPAERQRLQRDLSRKQEVYQVTP